MKATKNGTGYIDIEGISAIATAKVAEYIADGYIVMIFCDTCDDFWLL